MHLNSPISQRPLFDDVIRFSSSLWRNRPICGHAGSETGGGGRNMAYPARLTDQLVGGLLPVPSKGKEFKTDRENLTAWDRGT